MTGCLRQIFVYFFSSCISFKRIVIVPLDIFYSYDYDFGYYVQLHVVLFSLGGVGGLGGSVGGLGVVVGLVVVATGGGLGVGSGPLKNIEQAH